MRLFLFNFILFLFFAFSSQAQEVLPDSTNTGDIPFNVVEHMPALGPCIDLTKEERLQCTQLEIIKFVIENTVYPAQDKQDGIDGTVYVYFVVNNKGDVEQARILRSVSAGLDEEALRVVNALPKFDPGMQNGKKVAVQYTIPIKFVIQKKKKKK